MKIYLIENANVKQWLPYPPKKNPTPLDFATFKQQLINNTAHKAEDCSIQAAGHLGAYQGMEDDFFINTLSDCYGITVADWLHALSQSFEELSAEIHQKQADGKLGGAGCTFSGYLVLNDYIITIQMGDGGIFALHKDDNNAMNCTPLERSHHIDHEDEMCRILSHFVSPEEIEQIITEFENLKNSWKNDLMYYVKKIITDSLDWLPEKQQQKKIIENIQLLYRASANRDNTINAICSYLVCGIVHLNDKGEFHRLTPTRTFGNKKMHDLIGLKYCGPELRVYALPEKTTTFMLTSDGVTDALSAKEIANLAHQHSSDFHEQLLHSAYIANEKECDNICALSFSIAKGQLKNTVLFCAVVDGHGGQDYCDQDSHVIRYVSKHLSDRLTTKIKAKTALNQTLYQPHTYYPITPNWAVLADKLTELHQHQHNLAKSNKI